ncbi:hypothetical protein [Bradyrhizobium sp. NP1]|uniref:hypothetical protein n=1 Tax=Bradyrhizobium sp. NP1 TaxID=3049772 RepID=UPI0025A573D6|nr:hypothetical protein [Bradyrhizobium sp. NP1]WJR80443.1 hypothetical protein QOU61_12000 [Bradyrhizobium sp. NP1]
MRRLFGIALIGMLLTLVPAAFAQQPGISIPINRLPLAFGMTADEASMALGVPLIYVRGRPGNELYLALPNVKGMTLAYRSDALYLQFRKWHLTGWKGDWGTIRP